jgi:hypothetical protein
MLLTVTLAVSGCRTSPDWRALYSERLGRDIVEIDTAYLGREFQSPRGALTRTAWAKLGNQEMVLLGLPPHGFDPVEVVEKTVVLEQQEWKDACAQAIDEELWAWRIPHEHAGDSIRIYVNNEHEDYFELFFLPEGWELRRVVSHGIIKRRGLVGTGGITIEGVRVTEGEITIRGRSSLPNGTCLGSELWANGKLQAWWPSEAVVELENGHWQLVVERGARGVPAGLDQTAQYVVRVFQQNAPDVVSVFAFDLSTPPTSRP